MIYYGYFIYMVCTEYIHGVCVCMCTCLYARACVCMCACVCVHVYMYVYVCVCIVCIYCVVFILHIIGALIAASGSNEGNLTSSEGSQSSLQNSTLSSNGEHSRYACHPNIMYQNSRSCYYYMQVSKSFLVGRY